MAHARYKLLVDALVADIRAGRLPPGTRLPTHRALALMRERVSVSTAEPFTTTTHVPHAIRLALGSVEFDALREALETVKRVISGLSY